MDKLSFCIDMSFNPPLLNQRRELKGGATVFGNSDRTNRESIFPR